jgi:GNAT superfamily N-acetyltransferase
VNDIVVKPLAMHRHLLPMLEAWFVAEWPGWYGVGGCGSAEQDLREYASLGGVPLGLVAFQSGIPCGFIALKQGAFPSHPHLVPWVGAAYVEPSLRRRGIGRALFLALEPHAHALGYSRVYCASGTSESLLQRCGWLLLARVEHEGKELGIYEKAL